MVSRESLLVANQGGFHPNRGTIDNIVRLEISAQSALENKGYVMAVTLNLETANGLIWIKGLIHKLR